jgi:hypothetical protein
MYLTCRYGFFLTPVESWARHLAGKMPASVTAAKKSIRVFFISFANL